MRRVLFKAFYPCNDGNTTVYVNGHEHIGYWVYGDCHREGKYIYEPDGSVRYQVIPETMSEFSGIVTPTGTNMFENDICRWVNDDGDASFFTVVFENGAFLMRVGEHTFPLYECRDLPELDVAGNVFEVKYKKG